MTVRTILAIGTASAALAAAPALYAQDIEYDERVYSYGEPVPADDERSQSVDFRSDPVVQPVPAPVEQVRYVKEPAQQVRYVKAPTQQVRYVEPPVREQAPVEQVRYVEPAYAPAPQTVTRQVYAEPVRTRQVEYRDRYVPAPQYAPMQHAAPSHAAPYHAAPYQTAPLPAYAPAGAPAYDREAWLDECRERFGGRRGNGGVIGGLLGAVAGGVAGNRIYDSERLAGTLIGAGVGGLAGLAIGSVIAGSGRDRRGEDCEAYLERWEYQQRHGGAYYQGGYGYAQPYGYTMVPVQVAVPQRAVVREYVTTEVYTDYEEVVAEQPRYAPAPVKRQRYIKGD